MANFHGSELCINGSEVYTNGYCTAIVVLLFQLVKQSSFCVQCILAIFCVQSSLACSWPPAPCPWRLTPVLPPSSLPISPSSSPMSPPGGKRESHIDGSRDKAAEDIVLQGSCQPGFPTTQQTIWKKCFPCQCFFYLIDLALSYSLISQPHLLSQRHKLCPHQGL